MAYDLGYELDETIVADSPARLKALGNPLRSLILDLVLERAMTVTELAERVANRVARLPTTSTCSSTPGC